VKNKYPLPLIKEILIKVSKKPIKGRQWFTKFDIWWGYNNVQIKGDQWKAAFKTN